MIRNAWVSQHSWINVLHVSTSCADVNRGCRFLTLIVMKYLFVPM